MPADRDHILWTAGDRWRPLDEVTDTDTTVVTAHGTSRLLKPAAGLQARLPLTVGHRMPLDRLWQMWTSTPVASPCGLVTWTEDPINGWHATSPVVMLIDGLWPGWADDPQLWDRYLSHRAEVTAPVGHPAELCGALHCQRPRDLAH